MAIRRIRKLNPSFLRQIFFILISISILFLSLSSITYAQIQTRLRVVRASSIGHEIDPSLKELHKELKTFFSFTSYRLLREENLTLSLNKPVSITAREGRIIWEATLVGLHRGLAEVRIRVVSEGRETFNTQVRLTPGRTILVGGPRIRDGVIIYALFAKF